MTHLFSVIGPFAPALVLVLAAAESAAFVGVVVPGELAVILGGVAAGTGGVSLWLMIPAAVVGAIVGDSIGYSLGQRLGPALLGRPRMQRVKARLDDAAETISQRGWWALVVARFASVLRAVVPFAAGMARMRYRRFLLGNAVGGILWGTTFTLVGYVAGANYPRVERWIRTGGLAVVAVVALIGGIVWITRWAEHNREAVRRRLDRIARRRPIRYVVVGIRSTRRPALTLLLSATGIVASLWIFGALVQDVLGRDEFFLLDAGVIDYLARNQTAALIDIARIVDAVTAPVWIAALAAAAAAVLVVRRRLRVAAAVAVAAAGQWLIVELTHTVTNRTPPAIEPLVPRIGYGFPSQQVALVTTVLLLAAWPWVRGHWSTTVVRFGLAAIGVAVTGAARIVLLVEYPSDTLAAAAVAAAWTLLVCLAFSPRIELDDGTTQPGQSPPAVGLPG